ncbi:MAG: PTS sugar transporter subunit IIA [Candidatus Krumholzibacteriota bacterium]|nr:PTS sugar transporter subunit IIA [Candidatus Krumholzibacteriota bacterium]
MESEKLASFFEEDLCLFHLRSKKKNSVLQEMVRHLKKTGRVSDEQFIMEMLKNRESLGSTGLGLGVAFPHGRSLAIRKLTVLFGQSTAGIDFEALDGRPVNVFFLILAPSDKGADTYLALLSELIALIQKPDKLDRLLKVKDFESLIDILDGKE